MVLRKKVWLFPAVITLFISTMFISGWTQVIHEYTVHKTEMVLHINGRLDEAQWLAADLTEQFIYYKDGSAMTRPTQAKFLWDETYLYIGFICQDPDVWATMVNRDDHLWEGEVVEILCDPDGDGLNYFEVQVNPLETILDLFMTKSYYVGGNADLSWDLDSIKAAVWVDGTLNNLDSIDVQWQCEVALPFDELAFMGPSLHFPPVEGEEWRMLVTRYDYGRTGDKIVEVSSWTQTGNNGFHAPENFGRIIFSETDILSSIKSTDLSGLPDEFRLNRIYPNPFNPRTTIDFDVSSKSKIKITVYDILGREIVVLVNDDFSPGQHHVNWNGRNKFQIPAGSGVYILQISSEKFIQSEKMILLR